MQTRQEKLEYLREWRRKNPDKARAAAVRWRAANRDAIRQKNREYRDRNPEMVAARRRRYYEKNKERHCATSRRSALLRLYGITPEQRDEMFAAQGYACAVCKSPEPRGKRGWVIDHCHTTGRVRGILCAPCNGLLGMAADNDNTLRGAIEYLARYK